MEQLTQYLKNGKMEILEVPFPALGKGQVMVRNYYSAISVGTEGKTVKDARLGYIGKAKSRQKEVKQVIQSIKANGLKQTYNIVMNKLEAPSPLGYSCAGEVIAVADDIANFKVGDLVACGGGGAVHAEVVVVQKNLCVKIPENVDPKEAALTTIAAIAIQGIRQADLRFGENCTVIGLGLIGQLTLQILNASGIQAIGVDIDDRAVELAKKNNADLALNRNKPGVDRIIMDFTDGYGTDAVIITAGTSSTDPVNFAGEICRKKSKVVIVGAVPTGFDRNYYYKKELDLRMSSSYGPGRYDTNYEEKGIDYPIGYVRWTEKRNMKSYLDLIKAGKLSIGNLISHIFPLEKAPEAYKMILEKSEKFSGILIKYDTAKILKHDIVISEKKYRKREPNVGFIGAGSFAQNSILPRIKGACNFVGIATARGNNSRNIADKYGFGYCAENSDKIIKDKKINTVFIMTRHNFHAENVMKCLDEGKNVFVEKPLCMDLRELQVIKEKYLKLNGAKLMLGFNRRFAPQIVKAKSLFDDCQKKAINYRINAGFVPSDHWVHDPEIGGGRIIGEVCHFIDLVMYIAGHSIVTVSANSLNDPNNLMDTLVINLSFKNGSIASISYFSNGNKNLPKESIEIFCDGTAVIIDDFKRMVIYGEKTLKTRLNKQDKGHKEELKQFIGSIKNGGLTPISFEDIYHSTLATFAVIESLKTGRMINISDFEKAN